MNSNFNILKTAQESIKNQGEAILNLSNFIDSDFENSVKAIHAINGRVIVTGVGKSALIGKKIVATFNSTGTPAIFMHAAEAVHGDLGIVQDNDIVILISKSGNTSEIKTLVPFLKKIKVILIAISSDKSSFLGLNSDFFLKSFIKKEACPNNLAPTTSTTAQLVIGDALAICLSELNGFKKNDFARYHPGGSLGKELHLKVKEIILKNKKPSVKEKDNLTTIINEISNKMLGATAITNNNKAVGIITDGDLRRFLSSGKEMNTVSAKYFMSKIPKTINSETLASEALLIMNKNKITQLIVQDNDNYVGIIHLHNILNEGLS